MTLPDERYRAVIWAKRFLEKIAYDKENCPRVPKLVRSEARNVLRHFPDQFHMDVVGTAVPDIFQTRNPVDPLVMMICNHSVVKQGENNDKPVS